ncbi:MAG: DUF3108 domain-containing protein [Bacteroides sp.]|nr:DUF3108 domain-containing protein [Bacteroides sp.]
MFIIFCNTVSVFATEFTNESLNYVITYKWGLIHKDSGDATLKLTNNGDKYDIILTGKTRSWADNLYQVRDTLRCTINKNNFRPLSYTKIAHENGKYSRDEITYSYTGSTVNGLSKRYRYDKEGKLNVTEKNLSGNGTVYDMLSVFYYLRTIDYSKLLSGDVVKATMFSGKKVEQLTVWCVGKEEIKLRDKSKRDTYHIRFKFTQEGKKKSSDDIDAWISTDASHIPLLVVGSLPLGQVKCYYVGAR